MTQRVLEAYPSPSQTSKMKLFEKIIKDWNLWTIFEKVPS